MKATQFRAEWRDPPETEAAVKDLIDGHTLNFPCGQSLIGDVRADSDPDMAPDVVADLNDHPFAPRSFDTVYCDPPFSFYAYDVQFDWVLDLWKVARDRLILNQPLNSLRLPHATRSFVICDTPGGMGMTLLGVYDDRNESLSEFRD